jgi:hypothetical protein
MVGRQRKVYMSSSNCKVINIFSQSEVIYQNEEYFDAIVLECEEKCGNEVLIQQNDNCVNLHVNSIDHFIKSLRSVAAKGKSIVAAKSAANKPSAPKTKS